METTTPSSSPYQKSSSSPRGRAAAAAAATAATERTNNAVPHHSIGSPLASAPGGVGAANASASASLNASAGSASGFGSGHGSGETHFFSRSHNSQHPDDDDDDAAAAAAPRRPLRVLVCSGNLGNARPDARSLAEWIPADGCFSEVVAPPQRPPMAASSARNVVASPGGGPDGAASLMMPASYYDKKPAAASAATMTMTMAGHHHHHHHHPHLHPPPPPELSPAASGATSLTSLSTATPTRKTSSSSATSMSSANTTASEQAFPIPTAKEQTLLFRKLRRQYPMTTIQQNQQTRQNHSPLFRRKPNPNNNNSNNNNNGTSATTTATNDNGSSSRSNNNNNNNSQHQSNDMSVSSFHHKPNHTKPKAQQRRRHHEEEEEQKVEEANPMDLSHVDVDYDNSFPHHLLAPSLSSTSWVSSLNQGLDNNNNSTRSDDTDIDSHRLHPHHLNNNSNNNNNNSNDDIGDVDDDDDYFDIIVIGMQEATFDVKEDDPVVLLPVIQPLLRKTVGKAVHMGVQIGGTLVKSKDYIKKQQKKEHKQQKRRDNNMRRRSQRQRHSIVSAATNATDQSDSDKRNSNRNNNGGGDDGGGDDHHNHHNNNGFFGTDGADPKEAAALRPYTPPPLPQDPAGCGSAVDINKNDGRVALPPAPPPPPIPPPIPDSPSVSSMTTVGTYLAPDDSTPNSRSALNQRTNTSSALGAGDAKGGGAAAQGASEGGGPGKARTAIMDNWEKLMEERDSKVLQELLLNQLPSYDFVVRFQRGEMRLEILVRRSSCAVSTPTSGTSAARATGGRLSVESLAVRAHNTGLGVNGVLQGANKGGIVAELCVNETTRLTFCTAHLQAHEGRDNYRHRIRMAEAILDGTADEWTALGTTRTSLCGSGSADSRRRQHKRRRRRVSILCGMGGARKDDHDGDNRTTSNNKNRPLVTDKSRSRTTKSPQLPLDLAVKSHHFFFLGDLNFRSDLRLLDDYPSALLQNCLPIHHHDNPAGGSSHRLPSHHHRGNSDDTKNNYHAMGDGESLSSISTAPTTSGTGGIGGARFSKEDHNQMVRDLVHHEDWETLNRADELFAALHRRDMFVGFQTLPCYWPPTFKVERDHIGFVHKRQRRPSYTDRILWRSAPTLEDNVIALAYEPIPKFLTSDHKPIRGAFTVRINEPLRMKKISMQRRPSMFAVGSGSSTSSLPPKKKKGSRSTRSAASFASLLHGPKRNLLAHGSFSESSGRSRMPSIRALSGSHHNLMPRNETLHIFVSHIQCKIFKRDWGIMRRGPAAGASPIDVELAPDPYLSFISLPQELVKSRVSQWSKLKGLLRLGTNLQLDKTRSKETGEWVRTVHGFPRTRKLTNTYSPSWFCGSVDGAGRKTSARNVGGVGGEGITTTAAESDKKKDAAAKAKKKKKGKNQEDEEPLWMHMVVKTHRDDDGTPLDLSGAILMFCLMDHLPSLEDNLIGCYPFNIAHYFALKSNEAREQRRRRRLQRKRRQKQGLARMDSRSFDSSMYDYEDGDDYDDDDDDSDYLDGLSPVLEPEDSGGSGGRVNLGDMVGLTNNKTSGANLDPTSVTLDQEPLLKNGKQVGWISCNIDCYWMDGNDSRVVQHVLQTRNKLRQLDRRRSTIDGTSTTAAAAAESAASAAAAAAAATTTATDIHGTATSSPTAAAF